MDTLTAIHQRFSANHFADRPVSDDTLTALIDAARQAPSSFNQQHARFFAVQDLAARQTLRAIAFNQAKVEAAPLVIVDSVVTSYIIMEYSEQTLYLNARLHSST